MRNAFSSFILNNNNSTELATKSDLFIAAASIHGRAFDASQGSRIVTPFYNMPSQNEGLQPEFQAALPEAGGVKEKSKFKLFGDVPHGFAAARGKWETSELERTRAEEAIEEFVGFVNEIVGA